jgi:hypothetical protein
LEISIKHILEHWLLGLAWKKSQKYPDGGGRLASEGEKCELTGKILEKMTKLSSLQQK